MTPTSCSSARSSPPKAQTFAQQLIEQGKKAKLFGRATAANDPDKFKVPGSYVSNFAHRSTSSRTTRAIIAGWKKDNPGATLGSFGPPAYGAVQVTLNAIKRACDAGKGTIKDRKDILQPGQADQRQALDPRWELPLLDEDERPVERRSSTSSRSSRTAATSSSLPSSGSRAVSQRCGSGQCPEPLTLHRPLLDSPRP